MHLRHSHRHNRAADLVPYDVANGEPYRLLVRAASEVADARDAVHLDKTDDGHLVLRFERRHSVIEHGRVQPANDPDEQTRLNLRPVLGLQHARLDDREVLRPVDVVQHPAW